MLCLNVANEKAMLHNEKTAHMHQRRQDWGAVDWSKVKYDFTNVDWSTVKYDLSNVDFNTVQVAYVSSFVSCQ